MPQKSPVKGNTEQTAALSRLQRLKSLRRELSLSSVLVTDPVDVAYICGFRSSSVALLIGERKNRIITDFRYETAAKTFCVRHPEWSYQPSSSSVTESIAALLHSGERCGFQADHLTVDEFSRLKKSARGVKFLSCNGPLGALLFEKLPAEIRSMKRAAAIGDTALSRLLGEIRPGITEKAVAEKLDGYCHELGSEKPSFDTIVLAGERSALPHGRPGSRRLRRGDFILIDFGCTIDGFCSDMTRTVVIGKASARQRDIYGIVADAQEYARNNARAGMEAKEIDALARNRIEKAGYGTAFGHALGHGVGMRIHEAPRISPQVSVRVPGQTVITIEPGIYLPDFGGVRIEDMTVLTKSGAHTLTTAPRELVEL